MPRINLFQRLYKFFAVFVQNNTFTTDDDLINYIRLFHRTKETSCHHLEQHEELMKTLNHIKIKKILNPSETLV